MQLLNYIWRNVTRNKLRSSLTILSVGFSLALMTILHGYQAMQDIWADEAEQYHRIVVMNTQGFSGRLPISYVDRVRKMTGVKAASPYAWYGGNYKEEQMPFAQFGTDPKAVFNVWEEIKFREQLTAWQDTPNGCVVDRRLAEKRKWKIGEHIPIQGTFYPFHLDLVLCGIFDAPTYTDSLWFNWKYLDEGLQQLNNPAAGNAAMIFAKIESPELIPIVCQSIDSQFASSENPTRTQTEAAFAQMFADMAGNVQAYILLIGLVVVFSLSLVAASAMAMSTRERTTEIAVLKAIGFTRSRVLWLVLGEAFAIAFLGGLLGLVLGCGSLQLAHVVLARFFPFNVNEFAGAWLLLMLVAAAGVGVASGIVPAIQAARLSVVDGLRRVI